MITNIKISNVATFADEELTGLQRLNFIFGANGTGKTTISRIIANKTLFPDCQIQGESSEELEMLVYNQDFCHHNFSTGTVQGVFTLGKQQVETEKQIETLKLEIDKLDERIVQLVETLEGKYENIGKKKELQKLQETYKEKFWEKKYKDIFVKALQGYMGSKEKFMEKLIGEASTNQAMLLSQSELVTKKESIFSSNLEVQQEITRIDFGKLVKCEENVILQKQVIGKDGVNISTMIQKLQNSDWVRQGIVFYEKNGGCCPFCQQKTTEMFEKSLAEYFDESYSNDMQAIENLIATYQNSSQIILQAIQALIDTNSRFLDTEELKDKKDILQEYIKTNRQILEQKKKEASRKVQMESIKDILTEINGIIEKANAQIETHNQMVKNVKQGRETLTRQIWRFIAEEFKSDINTYNEEKSRIDKAIQSLEIQIQEKKKEKETKNTELRQLERQITTIKPTLEAINNLLASFGFTNFKLKENEGNQYRLVRQNGDDAHNSLSEGEKNFITFLYFYHLLNGSQSESGINANRVVVFDDPVSSLDNEILFIVSSLIRNLFPDVMKKTGNIKQIFVLTHNVYFHKQISYKQQGDRVSFFTVKKVDDKSMAEKHKDNPIKSSYELLWSEIRNENRSKLTLRNTLRRILENYFKLLGDIPLDSLQDKFIGRDKCICNSLVSWIHDGSHNASFDNVDYSDDDLTIDKYLYVFKEIFKKSGHIAHYNMMMKIDKQNDNSKN